MNIGKICRRPVVTIRPGDSLSTAARLMREHHIGYLIVADPQSSGAIRPLGVLTDRDIVLTVLAKEADPAALTAGDIMNSQPVTADESDSVESALQTMRRIGVRRLPVVGRRGELTGVLSLDDVIDTLASDIQELAGVIRNEQRIEGVLRT